MILNDFLSFLLFSYLLQQFLKVKFGNPAWAGVTSKSKPKELKLVLMHKESWMWLIHVGVCCYSAGIVMMQK